LQIYNTLAHKKQQFKSIKKGTVGMYSCGLTVYNYAHIGNTLCYVQTDLIKRVLMHNGYRVRHIMNITDVGHLVGDANLGEDKIRVTAEHEHKSLHEIAKFYTDDFLRDMKRLNLLMPELMPKASEHVPEMLGLIQRLDGKGYLYTIKTGVYFDTSKFQDYGRLMGLSFAELNKYLIAGMRVERASGLKNNTDFAVWRFSTKDQKEMVWETKYGRGFPGWHIECSAMSMKYLGEHFDLHTGGIDHLPIHHTNEIAQSESATGKKFVNFWMHVQHLMVDGKKMSKSLGNVYRLQDLVEKGYSVNSFKYLVLSSHYRNQMNFTFEALKNAENTLDGIYAFIGKVREVTGSERKPNGAFIKRAGKIRSEFFEALDNDINTPLALSKMHLLISEANRAYDKMSKAEADCILDALFDFDSVLGLDFEKQSKRKEVSQEAMALIEKRERLRKEKRYEEADKIRKMLKDEYRIEIEDTSRGVSVHRT
jgi:cysteinyl-tRNA synthetase